jgi:hypothetical protein
MASLPVDSMSDDHMQIAYHQVHHLLVRQHRGIQTLLFLGYQLYTHLSKKKLIRKDISTLTGAMWMDELIHNPNQTPIYDNMGM